MGHIYTANFEAPAANTLILAPTLEDLLTWVETLIKQRSDLEPLLSFRIRPNYSRVFTTKAGPGLCQKSLETEELTLIEAVAALGLKLVEESNG